MATKLLLSPVVLGNNLAVSATAGSSLTISGPVSQANAGTSVTLTGGGTLILSGSNTYTGGTTISGGTLEVANAAALPAKGIINVGRSGTVNLTALLVLPATAETSADEAPSDTSANEAPVVPSTPSGTATVRVAGLRSIRPTRLPTAIWRRFPSRARWRWGRPQPRCCWR